MKNLRKENSKKRIARKVHKCEVCDTAIWINEEYLEVTKFISENPRYISKGRRHLHCQKEVLEEHWGEIFLKGKYFNEKEMKKWRENSPSYILDSYYKSEATVCCEMFRYLGSSLGREITFCPYCGKCLNNKLGEYAKKIYNLLCEQDEGCIYSTYEIVREPKGLVQKVSRELILPKELKYIKNYYVNQTVNGGYTGDEYSGTVTYPLPNGEFVKINYSC